MSLTAKKTLVVAGAVEVDADFVKSLLQKAHLLEQFQSENLRLRQENLQLRHCNAQLQADRDFTILLPTSQNENRPPSLLAALPRSTNHFPLVKTEPLPDSTSRRPPLANPSILIPPPPQTQFMPILTPAALEPGENLPPVPTRARRKRALNPSTSPFKVAAGCQSPTIPPERTPKRQRLSINARALKPTTFNLKPASLETNVHKKEAPEDEEYFPSKGYKRPAPLTVTFGKKNVVRAHHRTLPRLEPGDNRAKFKAPKPPLGRLSQWFFCCHCQSAIYRVATANTKEKLEHHCVDQKRTIPTLRKRGKHCSHAGFCVREATLSEVEKHADVYMERATISDRVLAVVESLGVATAEQVIELCRRDSDPNGKQYTDSLSGLKKSGRLRVSGQTTTTRSKSKRPAKNSIGYTVDQYTVVGPLTVHFERTTSPKALQSPVAPSVVPITEMRFFESSKEK